MVKINNVEQVAARLERIAYLMVTDLKFAYDNIMTENEKQGHSFEQLEGLLISKLQGGAK
jgi:hypothetical protein